MDIGAEIEKFTRIESVDADELVLIYDLENRKEEFEKFLRNNKLIHKNTYLVQPCIEYHFLLHHQDSVASVDKVRSPNETMKELERHLPQYKKGSSFNWSKYKITQEQLELAKERSISGFKGYKQKSFSRIGHFIRDFLE